MSKSLRSPCVLFSRAGARLCIYILFVWSNLNFLQISQWIPLPTKSCVVLYSFCANLLHFLIMCLMVSSLSPHSLHFLFCYILSILVLIWLLLTALFFAAIRRDAVSLFKLFSSPFLFPSYCNSVVHRVSRIVSNGCKDSSIVFLYIMFESLYRCVNAVFNVGKSSAPLFSWCLLSVNVVSGM